MDKLNDLALGVVLLFLAMTCGREVASALQQPADTKLVTETAQLREEMWNTANEFCYVDQQRELICIQRERCSTDSECEQRNPHLTGF